MNHIEATRLLAVMAYRNREAFTDQEQLELLNACAIVLDGKEAAKAKAAAAHLEVALKERKKSEQAQGEFIDLLKGGRG